MKIKALTPKELKNNLWEVKKLSYNLYSDKYTESPILIWKTVQLVRYHKNNTCEIISESYNITDDELIKMIDLIKETNAKCRLHKRGYYYSIIF